MDLKGAACIVTGSSSGIGAACVRLLASKGCNVVINYSRSQDAAQAVARECEAKGVQALVCQADVSNDDDCQKLAAATVEKFGRIDGLINNAGTTKFCAHDDLDGLSAEDFHAIYAVNVVGPYQMIRAVAPTMKKQGHGAVVNVASMAGVMGTGSSVAYAASKGALNTMTLSLARSLGPEIRVNTVCPGFVQGSWLREGLGADVYDSALARLRENNPLAEAGQPEDMADTAVFFVEGAGMITGEFLMVDGGNHLGGATRVGR
ncbi:MAG: SDR family oxidoreductase [Gammaproteobacteria bacterium]|nr:SDR family oxidoreductase [Gammaproteobacteria bacterium]